jgi:hypothetical protein
MNNLYDFIIKETKPIFYIDLPKDEIFKKLSNLLRFRIIKEYGRDYYTDNLEIISELLKYYINDEINSNELIRDDIEELALYDNKWNNIRNPSADSPIIADDLSDLNIKLYVYQRAILYAMRIAEEKNYIFLENKKSYDKLSSDACCLSSRIGTGKTVMILAHILYLKNKEIDVNIPMFVKNEVCNSDYIPFKCIKTSIIFVNDSVYEQWKLDISKITKNIKLLTIKDASDVKKIIKEIDEIPNYDLILIRSGEITANVYAPWENKPNVIKRHLMNALASIFARYTFLRLFIDDFDVIKLPDNAGGLRANFYWYVSATNLKHKKSRKNENTISPFPRNAPSIIFDQFSISATDEFIDNCNLLPVMKIYATKFDSANEGFLNIMAKAAEGNEILSDIMELINSDSTDEVADKLGIKATSIHDIFKKILDKSYEPYIHAISMLEKIKILKKLHESKDEITKKQLKEINHSVRSNDYDFTILNTNDIFKNAISVNITRNDKIKKDEVEYFNNTLVQYRNTELNTLIGALEESANNQRNKEGAAIDRLRRSQTECQVCKCPLYDEDEPMDEDVKGTIAMPCCGKMFCSNCAIKGCKFLKNYRGVISGNCPSCRVDITPDKMIYISVKGILGNKIIEDTLVDIKEEDNKKTKETKETTEIDENEEFEKKFPVKFKSLLNIVNNRLPDNSMAVKIDYNGIMNGTNNIPDVFNADKTKILIVAKFKETYNKLCEYLTHHKIKFNYLHGSSLDKKNQIQDFQNDKELKVMILMTTSDCAGLNGLQIVTDCVFMHRLNSKETEAQAIGRCQRIGRDPNTPLRVHYLVYKNESF